MKGIPTANALKMSSGFTNESKKYHQRPMLKRAGGAMLIDIAELPNPNRRRRKVETIILVRIGILFLKITQIKMQQHNNMEKSSKDSKNKEKKTSTIITHEQHDILEKVDKEKEEKIMTEDEEAQNDGEYMGVEGEFQQKGIQNLFPLILFPIKLKAHPQ